MTSALDGLDSLLSTVQMPGGIPVGTLAIGKPGAINAALLAIAILALNDRGPRAEAREVPRGPDAEGARDEGPLGPAAPAAAQPLTSASVVRHPNGLRRSREREQMVEVGEVALAAEARRFAGGFRVPRRVVLFRDEFFCDPSWAIGNVLVGAMLRPEGAARDQVPSRTRDRDRAIIPPAIEPTEDQTMHMLITVFLPALAPDDGRCLRRPEARRARDPAGREIAPDDRPDAGQPGKADSPVVKLETTEGTIMLELNRKKAPKTVENFLNYVRKGFYDGHRVPPDHVGLHDPGRRDDRGRQPEADRQADRERGRQRA